MSARIRPGRTSVQEAARILVARYGNAAARVARNREDRAGCSTRAGFDTEGFYQRVGDAIDHLLAERSIR